MVRNKSWTVVVVIDGRILKATSDGTEAGTVFTGDESDVSYVKAAIRHKVSVFLGAERRSPEAVAGYESPIALTAALFSVAGPYTILWRAPKEVTKLIGNAEETPTKDEFVFLLEGE